MDIEKLNLGEREWHNLYMSHAVNERNDLIPFPKEEIQIITNGQKGEVTAKGAISIWKTIYGNVSKIVEINKDWKVLDYGCGWGRVTRILPFYFKSENIYGVDVDERLIESANELLPFLNHQRIKSMRPLPFEDGQFDFIFANSVFTHLSKVSALFTLRELSRILKKNGLIVISVLEEAEMREFFATPKQREWITKILGDESLASAELNEKGFIWGDTNRWDNYGIAIMKNDWIRKEFDDVGINFVLSAMEEHAGSQNYKFGLKK